MEIEKLSTLAANYLQRLCYEIPNRRVGSRGNRLATEFFASVLGGFGYDIECPEFDCLDHSLGEAFLTVAGVNIGIFASPYTLGCKVEAPLVSVATLEELERVDAASKILLVHGELAREQLMPKKFPFYNPEEHQQIIRLLEQKKPLAVLAATACNPELAGALCPFPLIEDGDFDIPSAYMSEETGMRLSSRTGAMVGLLIDAERIPARACNVIARKGDVSQCRVVYCAHVDAKPGTPGALDNAAGITVLLLLAELLRDYSKAPGVEILAINGEDYYAASGEVSYLKSSDARLDQICLVVNVDAPGYLHGGTAYSLYDCPESIAKSLDNVFARYRGIQQGESWYQGDHMVFAMNQVPAVAITSERFLQIASEVAHTEKDRPELVEPTKLAEIAVALRDLQLQLRSGS